MPGPADRRRDPGSLVGLEPGMAYAGRYQVESFLGSGGAGEVWAAHDLVADARVALKVLYPRPGEAAADQQRLARELRLVRGLSHPGVIRLFDIGQSRHSLYLVMEHLEGETLRDRLEREATLEPQETVRLLEEILTALEAAHAAGIVHRDLKPANIFLTRDGRVVLLDFGMARGGGDITLTATGSLLGTPEYLAPEMITSGGGVTAAADLYSLGIVAWEMVSGSPPFRADTPYEIIHAHVTRPLPAMRGGVERLPRRLRVLLRWMLQKSPELRPAGAREALEHLRGDSGILSGAWHRLRRRLLRTRFRRRARALAITGLAAILLLAGLLVLPARWSFQGQSVSLGGALGLRWRQWHLPDAVRDMAPIGRGGFWPQPRLALLANESAAMPAVFPDTFPDGLARLDPWRRQAEPVILEHPDDWSHGLPPALPYFDNQYRGTRLLATPWTDPDGSPILLAAYAHRSEYPDLLVAFSGDGHVQETLIHPGRLNPALMQFIPNPPDPPLLVVPGLNNLLGRRAVLMGWRPAVTMLRSRPGTPPVTHAPPTWTGSGGSAERAPDFYTFLGNVNHAVALEVEGRKGTLTLLDGRVMEADLLTGLPLSPTDRGGLDAGAWQAAQARLLPMLQSTRVYEEWGGLDEAAVLMETFRRKYPLGPAQTGVYEAWMARLFRASGHHEQALAAVRQALAAEPEISGHHMLLLDLLVRSGDWQQALELFGDPDSMRIPEALRDLVVGALLSDRVDDVRLVVASSRFTGPSSTQAIFCQALLALHEGRGEAAVELTDTMRSVRDSAPMALVSTLASLLADPPDPARSRASRDRLALTGGGGRPVPLAVLDAFLARMQGSDAIRPDAVQADLDVLAQAARSDLVCLYLVPWSEALAALAMADVAPDRAARLWASAGARPGAGPWLERLARLSGAAAPGS